MARMVVGLCVVASLLTAGRITAQEWTAAPAFHEFVPQISDIESRAQQALQKPITIAFNNTPADEGLRMLSEHAGVHIGWAPNLAAELSGTDHGITLHGEFHDVPVKSILTHSLRCEDEKIPLVVYAATTGIVITSREAPPAEQITRVYPIGDLIRDENDTKPLINLITSTTGSYWKATDGSQQICYHGMMFPMGGDEAAMLSTMVGSIVYLDSIRALVVKADGAAQSEIVELVRLIRQAKNVNEQIELARRPSTKDSDHP